MTPDVAVDDGDPKVSSESELDATEPTGTSVLRTGLAGGIYAALLVLMVRIAAAPLSNTDTFFHLRFGSEFLHHLSLIHI